jgi:hypothetical protein
VTGVTGSNFIGNNAGIQANDALNSNFIGNTSGGYSINNRASNFIGFNTGFQSSGNTYSNFIGFRVGYGMTNANTNPNNIIIGTNISLPNNTVNSLNLGGVLFGTGTYGTVTGNPLTGATTSGKIGVGVSTPTANLDIAPSTTLSALMRLRVGSAPTAPNDGDVWLESNTLTGLKIRLSGITRTITIT